MATPTNQPHEQPSTYMVQNRSNQEEMKRLLVQDQMLTSGMGGVLPEQTDPARLLSVLDVACGTGGWLIEVAQTYPTIERLVGVDISGKMIANAHARAQEEKVGERVEFRVMDALRGLEFPDTTFDLINIRLGDSWLRTWDWPQILHEFQRVARPGGIIRVTESDMLSEHGGSPALARLMELFLDALYQAGHYFAFNRIGILNDLPRMFQQYGLQNIQTREYVLEFHAGTPSGQYIYEDVRHAFQTFLPFLRKWTRVPENYNELYQQALSDVQQPGFYATWSFLTIWAVRSPVEERFHA